VTPGCFCSSRPRDRLSFICACFTRCACSCRAPLQVEHLRTKTGLSGHGPLYEILGLNPGSPATEAEVKKAYKALALKLHPDKNRDAPNPEAIAAQFEEVKAAYELLIEAMASGGSLNLADVSRVTGKKVGTGNAVIDSAVSKALSVVTSAKRDDDLSNRAAAIGAAKAAKDAAVKAAAVASGKRTFSETEG